MGVPRADFAGKRGTEGWTGQSHEMVIHVDPVVLDVHSLVFVLFQILTILEVFFQTAKTHCEVQRIHFDDRDARVAGAASLEDCYSSILHYIPFSNRWNVISFIS